MIYGVGYVMEDWMREMGDEGKERNFGMIDAVVKKDKVGRVRFKEEEG